VTQKAIPLLIVVVAVFVMFMSLMAYVVSIPRPSPSHEAIIGATTVKATIADDLIVALDAVCIDTMDKTVNALSIIDIARRGQWLNKKVPFSLWSFEYDGHPLAYIKVWGPHNDWFYVEFSRASMTTLEVDVKGEPALFPASVEDPPQSGFWWTWIEAT